MNFKKILFPFILFSSIFFWHNYVFAQNVTVAQDTTLTVGGYNYTLSSTSNALDQLAVDATSFTITTTLSNGTVTIRSADRINLGIPYNNGGIAVTTCNTAESVFVIQALASSARVVKVTPPISTAGDFVCNVATAAGGGGGSPGGSAAASASGGVSGAGTGTGAVSPAPKVTTPGQVEVQPEEEFSLEELEKALKDLKIAQKKELTVLKRQQKKELQALKKAHRKALKGLSAAERKTLKKKQAQELKTLKRAQNAILKALIVEHKKALKILQDQI